jgi:hypothetical protein
VRLVSATLSANFWSDPVAEGSRAMDERRAIKTMLTL